jgi:AcrR family transcriptional regulator
MPQRSHRDQLLEGAVQCLKTKGYARTTARDIAAAADANLASIGYHFGSKEALLNQAVVHISNEALRRSAEAAFAAEADTPLGRMAASWVAMLDSFAGDEGSLRVFFEAASQSQATPELHETMAAQYRRQRDDIAEMVRATLGADSEADLRVVASFLIAVYDGFALQWLLDPKDTPSGEQLTSALGAALAAALELAQADPA